MATQLIDLGNIRFIWKGDHDQTDTYELNDVVRYNNIVWVYVNPVPAANIAITNTAYWSRMVEGSEIPPTEGQAGKVLKTDGTLTFWSASFDEFRIGADITDFITAAGLTDVALGIQGSSTSFVQTALVNTGAGSSSSADFIAYTSNGTNESGWIDMGITNGSFNDPTFSLTGPGDGYVFMSGAIAGVVDVDQYSVAGSNLNLISDGPHGMIAGFIFDLILPVAPTLEGRYTVVSAPSATQVVVAVPAGYTGGNIALTSVINSQMNKFTGDGNMVLATDSTGLVNNIVIAAGGLQSGSEQIIITPDNGIEVYDEIYVGTGAKAFNTNAELTNAAAVFELNGNPYAQLAIHNQSSNSSTDFIAYADNGDDTSGWIDMGVTGSTFSQATFGITGPNDGYIFFEAPAGTSGAGNLVLATGANGSDNKIVFAAGGYDSGNEQMVIIPDERVHIEIATPSTSPTTGALTVVGGVGIQGDVNIQGDIVFGGSGTTLATTTLSVADPIIRVGSDNVADATDLGVVGEYATANTSALFTVTNTQIADNVATVTTSAAHGFSAGDVVVIAGVNATYNGTYVIRTAGATTFTFSKTNVDVASASATGTAQVTGNRKYAGLVRDASDGVVKFFKDSSVAPTAGVVNFGAAGLAYADIKTAGIEATTLSTSGLITAPGGLTASGAVSLSGTVDIQEMREQIVDVTLASNVGTLDWTAGNIYYIGTAPTANMTFNATNVPADASKALTINVLVTQGSTGYIPSTFQIAGTNQTIRWTGGVTPSGTSSAGKLDIFTFTLLRTSAGAWIVLGSYNLNF
jgi:hypothetical protein